MTDTANLSLPLIAAAQAQKHVTHNEALERLDALVQLSVEAISQNPPPSPAEGERHICAVGATGEWSGHDHEVAAFQGGAWVFHVPRTGWRAWVVTSAGLMVFDGSQWTAVASGGGGTVNLQNVPLAGVNATADASNRLTVSSPNSLLNHEGSDHRLKINRAASSDTASVVFQSDFSGRAEFGITGDDRFRLKVSADGSSWNDALSVDPATGRSTLAPADFRLFPGGTVIEQGHSQAPMLFPFGQRGYSGSTFTTISPSWRFKIPFFIAHDIDVSLVSYVVRTAGAPGARLRIGLRRWDRQAGWSFRELLFQTGEVPADVAGEQSIPIGPFTVPAGWYVLDVTSNDGTIGLLGQTWQYIEPVLGMRFVNSTLRPILALYALQAFGPLPADDPGTSYLAANEGHGNFSIGLS